MLQTQVAGKIKPHTPFKFSNVFPKTVLFIRRCRNIWWSQRRRKQYGGCAFTLETSFPRLCNNSHMHVNTHTHALTHASASARTHARAHTQEIRNTYCFFTATMVWRSASLLRYTQVASLVMCNYLPNINPCSNHRIHTISLRITGLRIVTSRENQAGYYVTSNQVVPSQGKSDQRFHRGMCMYL